MKMHEAMEIMAERPKRPKGYLVHFERVEGGMLCSDYFPDVHAGEKPISTEDEAWALAKRFASRTTGRCVNVYVTHSHDFTPVPEYLSRMIENR